jgi:DNA-binding Lrp family transcriptional regulator
MAIHAYVFIECTPGNPILVAEGLRSVPGVEMAHAVTGSYDVIAFVQAENLGVLGDLISTRIHRLSGVLKTTTNVVVASEATNGPTGSARGKRR